MKMMKLVIACALAVVAFTSSASATTVTPTNTNVTLASSNFTILTAGGANLCTSSTITGNTGTNPSPAPTVRSVSGLWSFSGCNYIAYPMTWGGCTTSTASTVGLAFHYSSPTSIPVTIDLPAGCNMNITYVAAGVPCNLRIAGPQTLNPSTLSSGTNSINWTNGSPGTLKLTNVTVLVTKISGGPVACPSSGAWAFNGTFTASPNVTVGP